MNYSFLHLVFTEYFARHVTILGRENLHTNSLEKIVTKETINARVITNVIVLGGVSKKGWNQGMVCHVGGTE